MSLIVITVALFVAAVASNPVPEERSIFLTTEKIIVRDGFPVEAHTVQTSDSYILTMYRIPYSPKLQNQNVQKKPVVYLQHGLLSTSDCWILNGPEHSLAYMLSNAGYDVWLGNFRGNTYSKKHAKLSPLLSKFWNFSWNEIAMNDIPAMVDYMLYKTGMEKVHYIGHSQGTTTFFVLTSTHPSYSSKFASAQMLAPVGYMDHMRSPLAKIGAPMLGDPGLFSSLFGSHEFMPNSKLMSLLGQPACNDKSPIQSMCSNVLFLICGWDSEYLNTTLLPQVLSTHPGGASTSQIIHYLQEYNSGYFRQYDHGKRSNKKIYGGLSAPPQYDIEDIEVPLHLYYAQNDLMAAEVDVERFARRAVRVKEMLLIPIKAFNHLDFLWSTLVPELNGRLLGVIADLEGAKN